MFKGASLMATSGSIDFKKTGDQIIIAAFGKLGVYGQGRTPSASDMDIGRTNLNIMIKKWITEGLHLWCREEGILFLQKNIGEYIISSDDLQMTMPCAKVSDTIISQLTSNAASGTITLNLLSSTNINIGDRVGVVLKDNTAYWTTVDTIPNNTTITLDSPLPNDATRLSLVYIVKNLLSKPLRIDNCRLTQGLDREEGPTLSEILMAPMAYSQYQNLTTKTVNGQSNQYSYLPQRDTGKLLLWPRPDSASQRINFTYERMIEDIDNVADDFDFPQEWYAALLWQLAAWMAPDFDREDKAAKFIVPMAQEMFNDLLAWDTENTSINLRPDLR